jgi:bacillithiol biosynthesis deacetylase BshB1
VSTAQGSTDVVVLAPHPDDAEMSCGGTILRLVAAGRRVAIVDATRGENASRGSPEVRRAECDAATAVLGVEVRLNLELPDAGVRDDDRALAAVVGALRSLRPRLLLAPADRDLHPDHEATGRLARRAWFHAGLAKVLPHLGPPHRPALLLHYPLHDEIEPTFCVDISAVAARKLQAVRCYATQYGGAERSHLARLDLLQRAEARDRFYGAQIGRPAAEPFRADSAVDVAALELLSSLA